jgi:hypothetical protein
LNVRAQFRQAACVVSGQLPITATSALSLAGFWPSRRLLRRASGKLTMSDAREFFVVLACIKRAIGK